MIITNVLSPIASHYQNAGYVPHFNRIDAGVVLEDGDCNKCGVKMRYIGLQKDMGDRTSYIAICHCDNCGNEYEF